MTCRAVLSIGANIGDSVARLRSVVSAAQADRILTAVSSVYATAPWGGVEQEDFRNAVLLVDWPGTPLELLDWCRAREAAADRTREVRWGPRTLDVDVVSVDTDSGELRSDDPELTLPHPRAAQRAFVLVPWMELQPRARLHGRPLGEHLAALDPGEVTGVRPLAETLITGAGQGR